MGQDRREALESLPAWVQSVGPEPPSLRVTATISAVLSPPEPESPRPRHHPAPRIGDHLPQLRVTELDSCRVAVSSSRVTLRSTASAPLLQSPVQRAGRAGRPSEASPYASVHESRDGRLVLALISYIRGASLIKRASLLGFEFCQRRRRPLRRPVRPWRATGRVITLRRTMHCLLAGSTRVRATGRLSTGPGGCVIEC